MLIGFEYCKKCGLERERGAAGGGGGGGGKEAGTNYRGPAVEVIPIVLLIILPHSVLSSFVERTN